MANNYFDEIKAKELIETYQSSLVYDEEGKIISKDEVAERKLMEEVLKIIKAIINVYHYYIFEEYDDLIQHAMMNCYTGIPRYAPNKGTCYNYFSIIAKISLLNYTSRRKKHRNHCDIEEQIDLEGRSETQWEVFLDDLSTQLDEIIDGNFLGTKRERYKKISFVLMRYIRQTKKFTGKSDMQAYLRSYAIKNTEVRAFIKDINKCSDIISEVL